MRMVEVPKAFYNIQSVLDIPPPKGNLDILPKIFPKGLLRQEMTKEKYIPIPKEVRELYSLWRPTPLIRARRLEQFLGLKNVKIFYKREDTSPTGSHKPNTAIMQAYLAKKEGYITVTTETGAGQWGSALAFACNLLSLNCRVYMVRCSYEQKPYRKTLMRIFGAEVVPSPSNRTSVGRKFLKANPRHPGSLGIAISEAIEDASNDEKTCYALGSVLNSVLMHQTIIGLETKEQLNEISEIDASDELVLVGCIGGGSSFGGFILPFVEDKLKGARIRFVAAEPKACPSVTKGEYRYDYGDSAKLTPMLKMYTLGCDFVPPPIHAGGLRYHGMAPIISLLAHRSVIEVRAYHQTEIFKAGITFAKCEGIVPAPETCHEVKAAIELALEYEKAGKRACIVMNFTGHGLLDLKGYEDYLDGKLRDVEYKPRY